MTKSADRPQVLLTHHLKALKLPTFLAEYEKVARESAAEGIDHTRYLLRLAELELIERERRLVDRRIRAAKFPAVKSLDTFDFLAIPTLNKMLVVELARSEYVIRNENIIELGNSGTGKTHVALALGLAACQKGYSVFFSSAATLVNRLMEARDGRQLSRLQAQLTAVRLLIIDELGYVPLSQAGAELLFEVFSQRYERGATIVTSNLPFEEWTSVLGSERLTGALLDRLTHPIDPVDVDVAQPAIDVVVPDRVSHHAACRAAHVHVAKAAGAASDVGRNLPPIGLSRKPILEVPIAVVVLAIVRSRDWRRVCVQEVGDALIVQ